ncbi:MAG: hypothetical protein IK122_02795, partial [Alphaproteobacteria bacterium]|nr:hypothetical protein [Alphaproteobacteria bacterium]
PIMKKKYCVDKSTKEFRIVEHESHQPITLTKQQYEEIKTKIKSDLADKGACDKGYLKLDIQFGTFNSGTFGLIENVHVDN